jgi:predicted kinase
MPLDYSEMIQARNIFLTVSLKGTGTSPIAYRLAQILQADIEEAEMDGANK